MQVQNMLSSAANHNKTFPKNKSANKSEVKQPFTYTLATLPTYKWRIVRSPLLLDQIYPNLSHLAFSYETK